MPVPVRPGTLHPWFVQAARSGVRSRPSLRAGLGMGLGLGLAATFLSLAGAAPSAVAAAALRLLAAWPVGTVAVVALVAGTSVARGLSRLARELQTGWLAALPLSRLRRSAPLAFVALAHVFAGSALWCALAALASLDPRGVAMASLAPCLAGLLLGVAVGSTGFLRGRTGEPAAARIAGRREPLFRRAGRGPPLSSVSAWQRRAVVLEWRQGQGGHFWLIGALLVLLPDRVDLRMAFGLLLTVASGLWLSLALRTCLRAGAQALHLLRATTLQRDVALRAALRYPAFAVACATATAVLGTAFLGSARTTLAYWATAVALSCVPGAWRLSRARRGDGS